MRMAVDASALLAVILDEPEADHFLAKLLAARELYISPVNWWEVEVRMSSLHGSAGEEKFAAWMKSLGVMVEPVTLEHANVAAKAFARFRGRPTRLNLGDCFAYALASVKQVPLLFKGNDFLGSDVRQA